MKKSKQPKPERGTKFNGWATFNWSNRINEVYRTRKQAQDSCCGSGETWDDVKDHMAVVKVKCIVV